MSIQFANRVNIGGTFSSSEETTVNIVCSHNTTWMLKTDGTLWGCGNNLYGQQGSGKQGSSYYVTTFTQRLTDVAQFDCSDTTTFAVKTDGTLWGCGGNEYGQQGTNSSSQTYYATFTNKNNQDNVVRVKCTNYETWILKKDGTLWGCGYNNVGQQGSSDTTNVITFTQRLTDVADFVLEGRAISSTASYGQIWALKKDGTLWHAGYNGYGQGGDGTTDNHTTFTQIASIIAEE